MPAPMNGICSSMLISLKVSQYRTRLPYASNSTRQYRTKASTIRRSFHPPYFWIRAMGVSKWQMVTSGSMPYLRHSSNTLR